MGRINENGLRIGKDSEGRTNTGNFFFRFWVNLGWYIELRVYLCVMH